MKHYIIGTAGHVDHGKTSLIRMLTGVDCDTHKEEKQRGITINLGFTHLDLPDGESAGIIDVPGHKDFISTMIGGACGIDMVLLVIAADSGIMPQTIEHLNIITSLGISKGVVALTRADLVDAELLEMAEYEVADYLSKTELREAPIVAVSSVTGQGKDNLLRAISQAVATLEPRRNDVLFRMYIDRIFSVKGHGSVVTGSVMSGRISPGQEVFLLPSENQKLKVRSIERHGKQVDSVVAGDRAAINLTGLRREEFVRGMIISDKMLEQTTMVDARVKLFTNSPTLSLWSNIIFISGTFECQARMHLLTRDVLKGDEEAIAQIHLSKPATLLNTDRFIIRNSSEDKTLGGGYVIDTAPLHHRKRTTELIRELTQLSESVLGENSTAEIISLFLKREFMPCTLTVAAAKLNMRVEEAAEAVTNGSSGFLAYKAGNETILINTQCDNSFRNRIVKTLTEHHKKNPMFPGGLESGELAGKLELAKAHPGKLYLSVLLQELLQTGVVDRHADTWIIKGHEPVYDKQSIAEITWLEQEILAYGDNKPVITEIEEKAAEQRIQKHKIKSYLQWLAANDKVRFCKTEFIHTEIYNKYRTIILQHLRENNGSTEFSRFKELTGGTKRFRALLIEMMEAEKLITLAPDKDGETRILLK